MGRRLIKRKPFVVSGQKYVVSLSAIAEKVTDLRVTIRADYGTHSFCTIRGLKNFEYYRNYGYWNDENHSGLRDTIEITPKMIEGLIRHVLQNGWDPEHTKSNLEFEFTNIQAKELLLEEN